MKYAISHLTTLKYAEPAQLAQFALRLRPREWPGQTVSDYVLTVDPQPGQILEGEGGYYVNEAKFMLRQPIARLQIASRFLAEVLPLPEEALAASGPTLTDLRERAMARPDLTSLSPASYIFASPIAQPEQAIAAWAGKFLSEAMPVMDAGRALMEAIHSQFDFDADATFADTPPIDAFNQRRGVCQDFTHIMIVAARAFGIPAAYVSGYLRTLPPKGKSRLVGADAMHAWANLWCGEDLGWVGFDPTNNLMVATDHIFIGMGRDYSDVAPLDGTFRGNAKQTMYFSVDVAPRD